MKGLLVVGEDGLCGALGARLVGDVMRGWQLSQPPIDCQGSSKLVAAIPRYCVQAMHVQPVICIADSDRACPVDLLGYWFPRGVPAGMQMRLAVTEAESWLLADHEGFSNAFKVSASALPRQPDEESDPKAVVLTLARRSRVREIRAEVVSQIDPNRRGVGYNQHLQAFVNRTWSARRAATRSPSLARAIARLESWRPGDTQ